MTSETVALPQLAGPMFLTDGGMETTFVFHDGLELPEFAAFDLLKDEAGCRAIEAYYRAYLDLARKHGVGFVMESVTWRANPDWAAVLGYSSAALDDVNRRSVELMRKVAADYQDLPHIVFSGCIGPRDDGYNPASIMTIEEARTYHARQVEVFKTCGVDLVTAMTITNVPEAAGIVLAAKDSGIPAVISFTVETNGALPTGETLQDAIATVDEAAAGGPAYYMINCAHPTHFQPALEQASWMQRVRGIRANASRCSHAELDEAETLDAGNPLELASQYLDMLEVHPQIRVLGGCCGTDIRHIQAIGEECIGADLAVSAG